MLNLEGVIITLCLTLTSFKIWITNTVDTLLFAGLSADYLDIGGILTKAPVSFPLTWT